jgi:hypothetical protein
MNRQQTKRALCFRLEMTLDRMQEHFKGLGNPSENVARGIAVDDSGGFAYVTGFTEDNFDGQPNAGGYDAFLMKFDLGANLL